MKVAALIANLFDCWFRFTAIRSSGYMKHPLPSPPPKWRRVRPAQEAKGGAVEHADTQAPSHRQIDGKIPQLTLTTPPEAPERGSRGFRVVEGVAQRLGSPQQTPQMTANTTANTAASTS
jgi:hypothetical protein